MKLRSDLTALIVIVLLSVSLGYSDENYFPYFYESITQEKKIEEVRSSSGGSRSSRHNDSKNDRENSLEIIDVSDRWGLTFLNHHLSFRAYQLARDIEGNDVFLLDSNSNPSGIVETDIKNNRIFIYPKSYGKTTVSAHVYNKHGDTITNSFLITVKEFLPNIIKDIPRQNLSLGETKDYNIDFLVDIIPGSDVNIININTNNEFLNFSFSDKDFTLTGNKVGDTEVDITLLDNFESILDVSFPATVTEAVYGR